MHPILLNYSFFFILKIFWTPPPLSDRTSRRHCFQCLKKIERWRNRSRLRPQKCFSHSLLSIETKMFRGSLMYLSISQRFLKVERWGMLRVLSTEVFIALMLPFALLIEKFIFALFLKVFKLRDSNQFYKRHPYEGHYDECRRDFNKTFARLD